MALQDVSKTPAQPASDASAASPRGEMAATPSMEISATLDGGMAFKTDFCTSGHTMVMDASPASGGENRGPRPMELLLAGLAGCSGIDVVSILRKMRQHVSSYEINVKGWRRGEHPKVFTTIVAEHVLTGEGLKPEAVQRAVKLSVEKYCSAGAMLAKSARLVTRYRVVDRATGAETTGEIVEG